MHRVQVLSRRIPTGPFCFRRLGANATKKACKRADDYVDVCNAHIYFASKSSQLSN